MRTLGWILITIGLFLFMGVVFLYLQEKTKIVSPLPDENVQIIEVGK